MASYKAFLPVDKVNVPEFIADAKRELSINEKIFLRGEPYGYASGIREQGYTVVNNLDRDFIITNITLTVAGASGVSSPSFVRISLSGNALITCGVDDDANGQNATSSMFFGIPQVWRRNNVLLIGCNPDPFPFIHFAFTITGYTVKDLEFK